MTEINSMSAAQDAGPHNIEAEQQLLGSILLDADRLDVIGDVLSDADFYDPVHAELFKEIARKHQAGEHVSPVSMRVFADGHEGLLELGGARYLVRLAGASLASSQVRHFAQLIAEYSAKRDLVRALETAKTELKDEGAYSGDVAARLEGLLAARTATSKNSTVSMMGATTTAMQIAVDAFNGLDTPGVPPGIDTLDRIMPKMRPGELILLGGRPSMGKSALALSIALNVARAGGGVAVSTLEMQPEAMAMRAISEATARGRDAVNYSRMNTPGLTERQMMSLRTAAEDVATLPIHFMPPTFRDSGAVLSGAKRAAALMGETCGLKLIVVDYLQLLNGKGRDRFEKIAEISIALKALAMQLQVPVLALSQLSRQVESRDDKRPMLSDLRESGQLEQDADSVMFCYRHEYYLEREEPNIGAAEKHVAWTEAMERCRNKMEIIVAKQRMGPIGTADVKFNPALNLVWCD